MTLNPKPLISRARLEGLGASGLYEAKLHLMSGFCRITYGLGRGSTLNKNAEG